MAMLKATKRATRRDKALVRRSLQMHLCVAPRRLLRVKTASGARGGGAVHAGPRGILRRERNVRGCCLAAAALS